MRILMVSDDRGDARLGVGHATRELAAALRALGHTCNLLFREDLGLWPRGERLRLAAGPALALRAVRRAVRQGTRAGLSYDVLDVASAEAAWLPAWRAAGGVPPGTALVVRTHGLEHFYYRELLADARAGLAHKGWARRLWFPLARLPQVAAAFRGADRAVALNQAECDFIVARGWKASREVTVIPHGVKLDADAPAASGRGAGLLFCGSWYHAKGVAYLVAAHARLAAQGLPLPLTVLGPGVDGHFEAQRDRVLAAFAPPWRGLITVLPRAAAPEVQRQYRRHDLLVSASVMEGCSLTLLEAMSQRLPVVCTTAGAARELFHATTAAPGELAALVAPRDAAGLADAIARLWRDPAARAAQAARAHRRVAELSWDRAARQTVDLYAAARAARRAA